MGRSGHKTLIIVFDVGFVDRDVFHRCVDFLVPEDSCHLLNAHALPGQHRGECSAETVRMDILDAAAFFQSVSASSGSRLV